MSALSAALGAGHEFHHEGKTYKVSLITQDVKLAFERKLFARAKETAKELRDLMDAEQYAEHLHQLGAEYQAGSYGLESERGQSYMQTIPGMALLVSLLFGVTDDEALRLIKGATAEIVALIRLIIQESYALSDEEMAAAEQTAAAEGLEKKVS